MLLAQHHFYIADPGCYAKMCVYNIRLEFQMEIEQRDVVRSLHGKGMEPPVIVVELAGACHKEAFDENIANPWLHEIKLPRSDLSDRPSSGRPPVDDIDARILQVSEAEPWSFDSNDC
jgi:hypothetical protein